MSIHDLKPPMHHSLLPHQSKFIDSYFSNQDAKVHCLVAPVGSGVTMTMVELTRALFETKPSARVLFLADSVALVTQLTQRLESSGLPAVVFNRFKYREIEDSGDFASLLDIKEGIYVSTIQFAVQPDVGNSLQSITWDLLIVNSNHFRKDTRNGEFISKLLGRSEILSAVVTVNALSLEMLACLPESLAITEWKLRDLITNTGEKLWNPGQAKMEMIPYQLTPQEGKIREILETIASLAQRLDIGSLGISQLIPLPSSDDLYNAEMRLRMLYSNLKQLRNNAAHGNTPESIGADLSLLEEILQMIERAFDVFDLQEADSKLEALIQRLRQAKGYAVKIAVTVKYYATAEYLKSALQPHFDNVRVMHAAIPGDERAHSLQRFLEVGGILIATEAMLEGIAFPNVDMVVPYEAPRTSQRAMQLLGRFLRLGREGPLTVLMLAEESGNPTEVIPEASSIRQALEELEADT